MGASQIAAATDSGATQRTAFKVLAAISFCHLLNDMVQSLLPALYPILKESFHLSFGDRADHADLPSDGVAAAAGGRLYTDRRPTPYSLAFGMGLTLAGLLLLSIARALPSCCWPRALVGLGSAVFHPESSRVARIASGGQHGFAQSLFQVGGNAGSSLGPLLAAFIVVPRGQSSVAWFSLRGAARDRRAHQGRRMVQARPSRRGPRAAKPQRESRAACRRARPLSPSPSCWR